MINFIFPTFSIWYTYLYRIESSGPNKFGMYKGSLNVNTDREPVKDLWFKNLTIQIIPIKTF